MYVCMCVCVCVCVCVGRDRVIGLAIRYRLDGHDVECRWGQNFLYPPA